MNKTKKNKMQSVSIVYVNNLMYRLHLDVFDQFRYHWHPEKLTSFILTKDNYLKPKGRNIYLQPDGKQFGSKKSAAKIYFHDRDMWVNSKKLYIDTRRYESDKLPQTFTVYPPNNLFALDFVVEPLYSSSSSSANLCPCL